MPLAVMFCTASLSTFLFLTLACTRWSKQAVFFTLVLNWKKKIMMDSERQKRKTDFIFLPSEKAFQCSCVRRQATNAAATPTEASLLHLALAEADK